MLEYFRPNTANMGGKFGPKIAVLSCRVTRQAGPLVGENGNSRAVQI